MVNRVRGAATAARYANTDLYGYGIKASSLPESEASWQSYTMKLVQRLKPESKQEVSRAISSLCRMHKKMTSDPIPDAEPHPQSGYCWRDISIIAIVGSNKFDRQLQKVNNRSIAARRKNGVYERTIKSKAAN